MPEGPGLFIDSNGIDTMVLNYVNGNLEAEAVWQRLGFRSVLTSAVGKHREVESWCSREKT